MQMQALPTRFESVIRGSALNFSPLIVRVDSDLLNFHKLRDHNAAQGAGSLTIIWGKSGTGKTTATYAAAVLMHDKFNAVLEVPAPHLVALRELPSWLGTHLPKPTRKITPVLFDGRESTDDQQGLRDLMAAMNNIARGRPDLLFVWPTTDEEWRDALVATARRLGTKSFIPEEAVFKVDGPAKGQWVEAVNLMLDQLESSWEEIGINEESANLLLDSSETLGGFITSINQVRSAQTIAAEEAVGLPEVVFIVSSHSRIVGDVARLRNPKTYRLRTDELIHSAKGSDGGKFWRSRGATRQANLAWVAALLKVKLVTVTPSTVAHACAVNCPPGSVVKQAMDRTSFRGTAANGRTAYRVTDLGRFFAGQPVPEITSTNKGKTSATTLAAYDAIQELSSKQHLAINRALLDFAATTSGEFSPADIQYEQDLGGDAIVDAIVPLKGRRIHLELHHISEAHCSPNRISAYIMKKLKVYAIQYNLVER